MGFRLVIVEEEKHWPRLAPHAPPFDVTVDKPLSALSRHEGETEPDYIQRMTGTLTALEKSLAALAKERHREGNNPVDKCRREILPALKDIFADPAQRDLIAESFSPIAQELVSGGAPAMAGSLLAALHHHKPADLRLPDKETMLAISRGIHDARPKSWDSYNGDTGGFSHSGSQTERYFENHAAIPLLLMTEPEFELTDDENNNIRWRFDSISFDGWIEMTQPHFDKTLTGNNVVRPFLLEILENKFEREADRCESTEMHVSFVAGIAKDFPHLKSKGAKILLETLHVELFDNGHTIAGEDIILTILNLQPDIITADHLLDAGDAFLEKGESFGYVLHAAKDHEHLQAAVAELKERKTPKRPVSEWTDGDGYDL